MKADELDEPSNHRQHLEIKPAEKLFHDPNCKKVKFVDFVDVSTI